MEKFYYEIVIHYGLVNNVCYDTREETFVTLEEAIQWSIDQGWDAPIKWTLDSFSPDYVGRVAFSCVEREDDEEEDYLEIYRMRWPA